MAETQTQSTENEVQFQIPLEAPQQITFMNISQDLGDQGVLQNIGMLFTMQQKDANGDPVRRALAFDIPAAEQLLEMLQSKIAETKQVQN